MVYDSEDVEEAQLSGPGPCIHHWNIEVEDRDSYVAKIRPTAVQSFLNLARAR
jgi:hypothetical protein